jgi:hypothetical protein
MTRVYCLRKIGTDEIAVCVASSHAQAIYLAGGKGWEHIADCTVGGFSNDERKHRQEWKELAKQKWFKEKI